MAAGHTRHPSASDRITRRSVLLAIAAAGTTLRCRAPKPTPPALQPSGLPAKPIPPPEPDEHLEPDDAVFDTGTLSRYHQLARDVLLADYPDRNCQMVALPSFREEYAVFLACVKGNAAIVVREAPVWTLYTEDEQHLRQQDASGLLARLKRAAHEYSTPVAQDTADLLHTVWTSVLRTVTASGSHSNGVDGTMYHFAHGERSGRTWSPVSASVCGRLVALADEMRALAADAPNGTERKLLARIRSLPSPLTDAQDQRRRLLTCR